MTKHVSKPEPISRYTLLNGLEFHYLDWGERESPLMLCLHGSTGQAHVWDFLAAEMGDRWRVIALDMRGHGQTQWTDDDYAIASFVSDIAALLEHLGVATISLIGLSLGGIVAMSYAGRYPQRVSQLFWSISRRR